MIALVKFIRAIGLFDSSHVHVRVLFHRYTNMHADYTGQGFDQLLDVINKIKNNPDDRRIILSAWNPSDLKSMALPPCHMFAQVRIVVLTTVGFDRIGIHGPA